MPLLKSFDIPMQVWYELFCEVSGFATELDTAGELARDDRPYYSNILVLIGFRVYTLHQLQTIRPKYLHLTRGFELTNEIWFNDGLIRQSVFSISLVAVKKFFR